ncbi:MAG: PP2C family serine/threonine-protein phosphatase [Myxococcota bacterium]|jgi:protein phosphatase|nr:protein phosphatase [Myxococcales bacterium]MEC7751155.1 PP2C family serine/threonine-protein phosphatase [Myxococcota bacterium]HBU47554.1 serine/threonine-protein phosphatase [Myxococcales bacterium]|tara:strand:- start:159 stop:911 length:753 start_codon:yes stop_codon:yes gene_type:complete
MKLRSSAATDVGRVRQLNEDAFHVDADRGLFIVADGMGGHNAGERASALAIESICDDLPKDCAELLEAQREYGKPDANAPAVKRVKNALAHANRSVFAASQEDADLSGMGTTATALLLLEDTAVIGHVGDSRAYLLRDDHLQQITEDHSLVTEWGLMPSHPLYAQYRNVITRSIGVEDNVEVDIYFVQVQPGDLLMMCSDGLSGMASDEEIATRLRGSFLDRAPNDLVELACAAGGDDNITVICIWFETD